MLEGLRHAFDSKESVPHGYSELTMEEISSEAPTSKRVADEDEAGRHAWKRPTQRRPEYSRQTIITFGALLCLAVGWSLGNVGSRADGVGRRPCDPYSPLGMLNISLEDPPSNRWIPFNAPPSCHPVDYVTAIRAVQDNQGTAEQNELLDFARNRTVVLLGDSVDRDHNEHSCQFMGGKHEMISDKHELSPPYPAGEEIPPEDYKNPFDGSRTWPNWDQSRPFICHVEKLNFRIVNVFHYGFRNKTEWIRHHPHFYPPARVEDRIDNIVVPLVANIARKYGVSPVPDILSCTPGFWGLLRQATSDDANRKALIKAGVSEEEANRQYDVWRSMTPEQRDWNQQRTEAIIRHMAKAWTSTDDSRRSRKPRLLWRTLHQIKAHWEIPFDRLQSLDQIGRAVVEQLVEESQAAMNGKKSWTAWLADVNERLGFHSAEPSRSEVIQADLKHRLKLDTWGDRILGTSVWFRDDLHPKPLPGNYLYSNHLMHHLKLAVSEQ